MNLQQINMWIAMPEMFILGMACLALLADLFMAKQYKFVGYAVVQLALIGGVILTLYQLSEMPSIGFNGLVIDDTLARVLKLFIYITAFFSFLYSRNYVAERNIPRGEYYILGLFSTLGMLVLVSAHSFITIYLGLELLALPLYAMVALQRDNVKATEAALKYFIMGAIASALLLYGLSMLYGATGSLDLSQVASAVTAPMPGGSTIYAFALVFIVAALAFKLAAAPFHMWAPDVYSGAPTSVTTFLSCAPKLAALGMLFRLLVLGVPALTPQWHQLLLLMAVLSMGIGNLLAIAQTNIKRMLAYSAIAHIGYMLLGLVAGNQEGYAASLFYMVIYSIMSVGAFGMLVLLSKKDLEVEQIDDLRGLNNRSPWLAFMMLLILFSMAGVPPTVGFLAKLFVLKALVVSHQVWLATLALAFAIWGAFYYIRVVKVMYFTEATDTSLIKCPRDMQWAMSINGLALLVLGFFPSSILTLCRQALGLG